MSPRAIRATLAVLLLGITTAVAVGCGRAAATAADASAADAGAGEPDGGGLACGAAGQPCCASVPCQVALTCNGAGFCIHGWAEWPMPNPASPSDDDGGAPALPNPAAYAIETTGAGIAVVDDRVTGLGWQRDVDDAVYTQVEAQQRCAELGRDGYAGFDDWRLPSRIELVSIVDFSRSSPAVDPSAFPDTPGAYFWTSSAVAATGYGWCVSFDLGDTFSLAATETAKVRCVR
jgi:hypothetical protein